MARRKTPSSGLSISRLPAMCGNLRLAAQACRLLLFEHDERVALVDRLALFAEDLLHHAGLLRLDRHLHLHGLERDDGVALFDDVADLALDLPHDARDVG